MSGNEIRIIARRKGKNPRILPRLRPLEGGVLDGRNILGEDLNGDSWIKVKLWSYVFIYFTSGSSILQGSWAR